MVCRKDVETGELFYLIRMIQRHAECRAGSTVVARDIELFEPEIPGELNIHVLLASSGNPAFLLGRFGFADPDATQAWIHQLIEDEKAANPEVVFAEVVHLPEDRTGNILQRPSFLDYEIPYLARSPKPHDQQVPVTDLMAVLMVLISTGSLFRLPLII